MSEVRKLVTALHDLHPWGGQDKSNLEIFYHLNQKVPVDIHSFQFIDNREWPQARHHAYKALLNRPVLLKSLQYSLASAWRLRQYGKAARRKADGVVIQSTGTSSFVTDVIQVQYIHKAWQEVKKTIELPDIIDWKTGYHFINEKYNVAMENLIFRPDKNYIAISHSVKKELMQYFGIPSKNIETIYHGVSPEQFFPHASTEKSQAVRRELRLSHGLKDTDVALLHVGALNERKGVHCAIHTLAALKKEGVDNVYYLAVGQGDRPRFEKLAAQEGVSQKIKFISHSKNVKDYYWLADMFFFPSLYEPFGLVIMEALASGLPALVSGAAGATELITHGENGLIIENVLDPQSMANQIMTLLKNPDRMKSIGDAAARLAREHSWDKVADRYMEFYQALLR